MFIEKWSNNLHCIVQLLKKIPQTEENEKHAQECIDILFKPAKTEHHGSFQRSDYGTRNNFQHLNFAILLVILTWHGLKPMFKDNLEKWSNNLHYIVQLLKIIPQTEENDKRVQECINILFKLAKTEHYGSFDLV
jgi:hypothetical protein